MKSPPRFSMCGMGESSLSPFKASKWSKIYRSPGMLLKNAVRRFFTPRHAPNSPPPAETPRPQPAATEPPASGSPESSEARDTVRRYFEEQTASVDRAVRFREQAERLEGEGTPSESARNKAERARWEVASGLSTLRASFIAGQGGEPEAAREFDREVERTFPAFKPPDAPPAPTS